MSLSAFLQSPRPRRIGRAAAVLAGLALLALLGATAYYVHRIRAHPVMTFETARSTPAQVREFSLSERYDPAAWGLPFRTETYRSRPDGLRLDGWFVPATARAAARRSTPAWR